MDLAASEPISAPRSDQFMISFVSPDRAFTTALTSQASIGASITTNNGEGNSIEGGL